MPNETILLSNVFFNQAFQAQLKSSPVHYREEDVCQFTCATTTHRYFGYYRQSGDQRSLMSMYSMSEGPISGFVEEEYDISGNLHFRRYYCNQLNALESMDIQEKIAPEVIKSLNIDIHLEGDRETLALYEFFLKTFSHSRDFTPDYQQFGFRLVTQKIRILPSCIKKTTVNTFELSSFQNTDGRLAGAHLMLVNQLPTLTQARFLNDDKLTPHGPNSVMRRYLRVPLNTHIGPGYREGVEFERLAFSQNNQRFLFAITDCVGALDHGKFHGPVRTGRPGFTVSLQYAHGAALPIPGEVQYDSGAKGFLVIKEGREYIYAKKSTGDFVFFLNDNEVGARTFLCAAAIADKAVFTHLTDHIAYDDLQSLSTLTIGSILPEHYFGENFGKPLKNHAPTIPSIEWMSHQALADFSQTFANVVKACDVDSNLRNDLHIVLSYFLISRKIIARFYLASSIFKHSKISLCGFVNSVRI